MKNTGPAAYGINRTFSFRKRVFGSAGKKIIFFICGWQTKIWHHYLPLLILRLHGYRCIAYEYSDSVLFSPITSTVKNTMAVKQDIINEIRKLKNKEAVEISIFGTSYGTIISFLAANEETAIKKLIVNLTTADIAEAIWTWNTGVIGAAKAAITKQGVTLPKLKRLWRLLSPENNISNMAGRQILYYLARKDEVIPYKTQIRLVKKLRKVNPTIQVKTDTWLNHMWAALVNLLRFPTYIRFLETSS